MRRDPWSSGPAHARPAAGLRRVALRADGVALLRVRFHLHGRAGLGRTSPPSPLDVVP